MDIDRIGAAFSERFGGSPAFVVRAPGRVNLIGEHTDYNDGFVFPAAIEFDVVVAGSPRADRAVRALSLVYGQQTAFDLDRIERSAEAPWSNYLRGVACVLTSAGHGLLGMDAVVDGAVPLGSGLSSSAAIEVASSLAFESAAGIALDPVQRALLCQRAEREFVGVQCGIMDQFISALGRRGHALFVDTRTLEYRPVPLPASGVSIVIANTNRPRSLTTSAYNERRSQCEQAVAALRQQAVVVQALRDVTLALLSAHRAAMTDVVYRRARHVVSENQRVLDSVQALERGDVRTFGRLMVESHASLRDDYQVSCAELDALVEAALEAPGVLGSRMTGAGFGGCTVSLIEEGAVDDFRERVGSRYRDTVGYDATFHVTRAADGAERVA
ncbi:MAG TPA: galactokinase [Chthonomonadales bacterium]|nr:galactokinase [Chthonomonadales bacterium]